MGFKKAERKQVFLKIGITGTSGSGKTYSSLLMARGLVGDEGRIAVIDTENNSASLYSHITDFDAQALEPPFTVPKYTKAITEAIEGKYDALIIDSLSHAWLQVLAEKEQIDSRGGNSFTNWAKVNPKHKAFLDALLQSNIHIFGSMRSKTHWDMQKNDKGKVQPVKIGLAPVQREGMEYEFTLVLDMTQDHSCKSTKDRTSLFPEDFIFTPDLIHGDMLRNWLKGGKPMEKKSEPIVEPEAKEEKRQDKIDGVQLKGFNKAMEMILDSKSLDELRTVATGIDKTELFEGQIDQMREVINAKAEELKK